MNTAGLISSGPAGQQTPPATVPSSSDPKPCQHGGRHEHGSRSRYRFDECRCLPCTHANSHYQAERNQLIEAGLWAPLVDAAPVAAHVRALVDAGLQRSRVAERAAVAASVVSKLLTDRIGTRPLRRVRAETARRLLAVPHPGIDATGTRRRLQALVAIGWPPPALDEQAGEQAGWAERLLGQDLVDTTTAGQVAWLFERLWDCPPPQQTVEEKSAAEQARERAKRHGWGPPMAWDDELNPIDDPNAEADLGGPVCRRSKLPPAEELQYLLDAGESMEMIAARFGVKPAAVRKALERGRAAAPAERAEAAAAAAADEAAA